MGRPEVEFNLRKANLVDVNRFVFLLLPGFSALDLGSGIDSLSAANEVSGKTIFHWQIVSETGEPVASSSGISVAAEGPLPEIRRHDCIVVCGPLSLAQTPSSKLKGWLRRAARSGAQLCGLGGGTVLLAHVGLVNQHRVSVHWQLQPALSELFPELDPVCTIYENEASIVTSGGGATTLDLFSALISWRCGSEIADQVSDRLLSSTVRSRGDRQTRSDLCRYGFRHEKLAMALQYVQRNLEHPISPPQIAEQVGLSTRQLERLFLRYVESSPKTYVTSLRLARARLLLQQTQMLVIDVAISCGYTSTSHFSKLYRNHYGTSPFAVRSGE